MFWGSNKIKAVFFDVGGVLLDVDLDRYVQICCAKLRTTPEPLQREVALRVPKLECGTMDSAAFWREIGEALWRRGEGYMGEESDFLHLWRDLMSSSMIINTEVVRLAQTLSQKGVQVGILSNAIEEHAEYLQERGVYAPFNPCVISCRVGLRKPDSAIYRLAAQRAGVKLPQCLFIDDMPGNVESAQRLGMQGLVFSDAPQLAQDLGKLGLL